MSRTRKRKALIQATGELELPHPIRNACLQPPPGPTLKVGMSRATQGISNREFVRTLRSRVEEYLRAVDEWETTYRKFYRVRGKSDPLRPSFRPRIMWQSSFRFPTMCSSLLVRDGIEGQISLDRFSI